MTGHNYVVLLGWLFFNSTLKVKYYFVNVSAVWYCLVRQLPRPKPEEFTEVGENCTAYYQEGAAIHGEPLHPVVQEKGQQDH